MSIHTSIYSCTQATVCFKTMDALPDLMQVRAYACRYVYGNIENERQQMCVSAKVLQSKIHVCCIVMVPVQVEHAVTTNPTITL